MYVRLVASSPGPSQFFNVARWTTGGPGPPGTRHHVREREMVREGLMNERGQGAVSTRSAHAYCTAHNSVPLYAEQVARRQTVTLAEVKLVTQAGYSWLVIYIHSSHFFQEDSCCTARASPRTSGLVSSHLTWFVDRAIATNWLNWAVWGSFLSVKMPGHPIYCVLIPFFVSSCDGWPSLARQVSF